MYHILFVCSPVAPSSCIVAPITISHQLIALRTPPGQLLPLLDNITIPFAMNAMAHVDEEVDVPVVLLDARIMAVLVSLTSRKILCAAHDLAIKFDLALLKIV